ncbi:MAG: NADP transhydrogenase subunit alpha [Chloroflexi bacterium]|nr:NADP transhydrogenase subunit alpha [Chloroflexota bacterium]
MTVVKPTILVIGAGHGGKAMAADLAVKGFAVRLYNRTYTRIEMIALRGGVELEFEDGRSAFGPLEMVTSDLEMAMEGVKVVMVVVPASAHAEIAEQCAPLLEDGQVIILNPGRTGGALEFRRMLDVKGCRASAVVAEAQTFVLSSRSVGPAEAKLFRSKITVPLAALPATDTSKALQAVRAAYPQFIPARNVLETSLDNMGAVMHPSLTILNAGRIESTRGDFQFYIDGATPGVAMVLEQVDAERLAVAQAMGVRARSALEWLRAAYASTGDDLFHAIQGTPTYRGVAAPRSLMHRYLFEDVPMSLVPMATLGAQYGAETPTIRALVQMACVLHGKDYFALGRTPARLGIAGMSVEQLTRYVEGK